jgi:hypothetical protein
MESMYKRIENKIYTHNVLSFTMPTINSAKRLLTALNKNYETITKTAETGESSKDIAIKHGCSEFHGIFR